MQRFKVKFNTVDKKEVIPGTKSDGLELLISLGAVGAGFLLRKLMENGYRKVYDEEAPDKIDGREIEWAKLVGWTVVSGITVTALKVLIKRYGGRHLEKS